MGGGEKLLKLGFRIYMTWLNFKMKYVFLVHCYYCHLHFVNNNTPIVLSAPFYPLPLWFFSSPYIYTV